MSSNSNSIVFDWLQFTIKDKYFSGMAFFIDVLGIHRDFIVIENKGFYGYNETYSYRDIKVFSHTDREEMGVHVYISGRGCRDLEELGIDFLTLFNKLCFGYDVSFTRVDVAIDTFNNNYYDLEKIKNYINNKQVVSKLRSYIRFYKGCISDMQPLGNTIQFGSLTSDVMIVFYDKKLEREDKAFIVDTNIKYWFRCEIRFRNNTANELIKKIVINEENVSFVVCSVLYNYLDFKDYGTDKNKSRWSTSQWWLNYLGTTKKLQLNKGRKESNIITKKAWLDNSVSKTQLLYLLSQYNNSLSVDDMSLDYLYNNLKKGSKKLLDKDLKIINDYRITNGYEPLERQDIYKYIKELQDLLLNLQRE